MSKLSVLIVEDEVMVSMILEDFIDEAGHAVAGTAATLEAALAMVADGRDIHCALLDVNLRGQQSYPVADALDARGIPYAFTSGYGADGIDARFKDRMVLPKPIDMSQLTAFLAKLAQARTSAT